MDHAEADAEFHVRLERIASEIETLLAELLEGTSGSGQRPWPARLKMAMRHAVLGGGKRLRPFLVVESAALFAVPREHALQVGAALECLHCYSLVHDDLPALDNDDMRRGRPTVHRAFDEATAVLVGDALLTLAFDIMSRETTHPDPRVRNRLVATLAEAAGPGGMVGGQMLDLMADGRFSDPQRALSLAAEEIVALQAMKTGALLRFACMAGAHMADEHGEKRVALARYGAALGEAFQISDDLLDASGEATMVGKATGKDARAGKATLVGLFGVAGAQARLEGLVDAAQSALECFGTQADVLRAAVRFVAHRRT